MEIVTVKTKSKEYPVYIGSGIIKELPRFVGENCKSVSKVLVISDQTVSQLYLQTIMDQLANTYEAISYVIPSGESSKSFDIYNKCQTFALANRLDRSSLIIALGGGVVGDLAGFVAATFMRGIPFIQVPTTLLAHDSAVGGKVAINHNLGKNMIGAFHQPNAVVYDIDFMKTLPLDELRSGFAEVIKHGLIWDNSFFEWLSEEITSLEDLKEEKLQYAVVKGISIKAEVVSVDEEEKGIRAFLNFGHTLGHAIEAELGYGNITHGDGVAIGMVFAMKVGETLSNHEIYSERIANWLQKFDFPVTIPMQLEATKLLSRMKHDKKVTSGKVRMVLLKEIGEVEIVEVDDERLLSLLA
ncbi:3-dehydroquinate synthase [Fredinandcohnia quinoae]|uniref:3-dehydroquinate synthase n=1 Tax=Fredinandcohnia quinoae TaxID=2918902 RepID=A0AAW5DXF8_9BACI|nr:3-dehydroquinate synthase [Fredinandcohnia sp. SECRCQ15]MCH1624748.1 3-dehydroquinate synthase [Fredinandcohnia sp. SECRCQ15]